MSLDWTNPSWFLLVLGMGLSIFLYKKMMKWLNRQVPSADGNREASIVVACIVTLIACWFVGKISIVSYGPGTVLVRDGTVIASFPEKATMWRWAHPEWRTATELSYAAQLVAVNKLIEGMTQNPGIRKVQVHVQLESAGTPESFMMFRQSDWGGNPGSRLRSVMNRFDKTHHSVVAETCYDDQDTSQQAKLQDMVKQFLEPEIAGKGLRLKTAYFTLP
jgi:hypothetical protein